VEKHGRVDVVLWHYSVFAYGPHGIPVVSWPLAWALRRARVPVVTVLHEYAFPWGSNGWRGVVWAAAQRLALAAVVGASSGLVVTVDERAEWLGQRVWLPDRSTVITPVFSNLPEDLTLPSPRFGPMRIGMFGYPISSAPLITEAVAHARATGVAAELWLLGSPGPDTAVGEVWRQAGTTADLGGTMAFTGVLGPEALANELRRCDILFFDDGAGPASRKGTLAAALASGRPVVAVDSSTSSRVPVATGCSLPCWQAQWWPRWSGPRWLYQATSRPPALGAGGMGLRLPHCLWHHASRVQFSSRDSRAKARRPPTFELVG
jgi:hypothetical protein